MADIITVAEYEDYDGLPSPVEIQTKTDITNAITNATAVIEDETGGRTFVVADPSPSVHDLTELAEIVDGRNAKRIYVKNGPIQSVSKIEYWDGDEWQEITYVSQPFTFKPNTHIVYYQDGSKFSSGYQNYRVTYSYGFDNDFPQKLKYACYLIAKSIYNLSNRQGITTQQDGEQNWNYSHDAPKMAVDIIAKYRHFV